MSGQVITMALPLYLIDPVCVGSASDRPADAKKVSDFLTNELSKVGGTAIVEVDDNVASVKWVLPTVTEGDDIARVVYVGHLLQSGIMLNPMRPIANTAYAGNGVALAKSLLMINARRIDCRMAERDAALLADCVPLMTTAWVVLGMIQLDNGHLKQAQESFDYALMIDPADIMAKKFLAITHTLKKPLLAVRLLGEVIEDLSVGGAVPEKHVRAAYGMAMLSAGMLSEAAIQFRVAFSFSKPKMTVKDWVKWGYRAGENILAGTLLDPIEGKKLMDTYNMD
jgi:hypothetical protein